MVLITHYAVEEIPGSGSAGECNVPDDLKQLAQHGRLHHFRVKNSPGATIALQWELSMAITVLKAHIETTACSGDIAQTMERNIAVYCLALSCHQRTDCDRLHAPYYPSMALKTS